ncbi:uncharacterized protein PHALS_03617 [Plasmopara halstedii]|uniref:Uncharacterized protein n=1 Tax=Plasmopara halstedii TaxID=4781 RepID=A0A0P1AXF9_PLAHL|nr:uncharacterized protein PHALS_03617 [Plasmopara halstedii]CEG46948.1 hypothetical protein PHALS_03617 [Plasmopara halstedii]|eukprot:XP_024583317.1 hypothetical protein PHALS_03617 [Plasmopara halstedii]
MATSDCDVCSYLATCKTSCGFLAFRAGLARVKINALKAACEHQIGPKSVFGMQVRDQFIDLLWESCLAAQRKQVPVVTTTIPKRVNVTTMQLSEPSFKKKKTEMGPVDVTVTMGDIQVVSSPFEKETTATHLVLSNLEKEAERLRADNQRFVENFQQLVEKQEQLENKYAELALHVKRLQSQQNVYDRLVCTVYDKQQSFNKKPN